LQALVAVARDMRAKAVDRRDACQWTRRSPAEDPETGRLVAMAVIKTIRQLAAPVVVGG